MKLAKIWLHTCFYLYVVSNNWIHHGDNTRAWMCYIYSFAQNTLRAHIDKYLSTNQNSSTKTRDYDQNRTKKQYSCIFWTFYSSIILIIIKLNTQKFMIKNQNIVSSWPLCRYVLTYFLNISDDGLWSLQTLTIDLQITFSCRFYTYS